MSARPRSNDPALFSPEGELIFLRISIEPRLLEDLLEALALLSFPINPQLYHRPARVIVEFPAYSNQLEEVRAALKRQRLNPESLEISRVLAAAAST